MAIRVGRPATRAIGGFSKDPLPSNPLIARTRELASAINLASYATPAVGRKGDCKGSLVTVHCVT